MPKEEFSLITVTVSVLNENHHQSEYEKQKTNKNKTKKIFFDKIKRILWINVIFYPDERIFIGLCQTSYKIDHWKTVFAASDLGLHCLQGIFF